MSSNRDAKLRAVRNLVFVVWDTDRDRGWLLFGDAVALHLLRIVIGDTFPPEKFDFASLKILEDVADSDAPAYEVLNTFNTIQETSIGRIAKGYSDTDSEEEKQLKKSIGEQLDTIYGQLLKLSDDEQRIKQDQAKQLSGSFKSWYEEKWGSSLRGWDYKSLASIRQLITSVHKLEKHPSWLKMARQLGAIFLLEKGFGEFLEPRAGSCCPYFPALPAGKGFLACGMEAVGQLIRFSGGSDEFDLPESSVARLSFDQGWEHDLDPFARPNCQGDHLSTLDPSCFPVQQIRDAKYVKPEKRPQTDMKLIKEKRLYTKEEVQLMVNKHPKGVVVFGRQPSCEELKEMARRNGHRATQNAKATGAEPSNSPLSRGSTQGSTGQVPTPAPTASPGRPSTASAQRAPSLNSLRRAVPNTQTRASGTTTAARQLRASTPNSSAASIHKASSNARLRSTGSNLHPRDSLGNNTGARQLQSTASQTPVASLLRPASNASLRSTGSTAHPRASNAGSSRSHESSEENNTSKATRKPSNSSVRTTSSVASRATGSSQSQKPHAQLSVTGLEKTDTNSSDKTTSSHSSRTTQNSAAGSTAAKNRQRQLLEQSVSTTVAAGTLAPGQPVSSNHGTNSGGSTENPPTTSSGPAPTGSGGPEGSS